MRVLENELKKVVIEKGEFTYLISYNSVIAKVNNTINPKLNSYGLYLSNMWDFSNTTLKHLYDFIEVYTTQRDDKGNMFAYQLGNEKNKKAYIQKQIDNKNIRLISELKM